MSWYDRYCAKHPNQKLTLLFTQAVCDVCDPPKSQKKPSDSFSWNSTGSIKLDPACSSLHQRYSTTKQNGATVSMKDKDNFLICSTCMLRFSSITHNGNGHSYRCTNGHKESFEPVVGDKIECSQLWSSTGNRYPDYKWNGRTWELL